MSLYNNKLTTAQRSDVHKRWLYVFFSSFSRELGVVRLGEFNLTTDLETTHLDFSVDQIFVHEQYNPPALYNDIALVQYVCWGCDVKLFKPIKHYTACVLVIGVKFTARAVVFEGSHSRSSSQDWWEQPACRTPGRFFSLAKPSIWRRGDWLVKQVLLIDMTFFFFFFFFLKQDIKICCLRHLCW